MTLNAFKFGMASAITAAILWLVCSLLVMLTPSMMLSMLILDFGFQYTQLIARMSLFLHPLFIQV